LQFSEGLNKDKSAYKNNHLNKSENSRHTSHELLFSSIPALVQFKMQKAQFFFDFKTNLCKQTKTNLIELLQESHVVLLGEDTRVILLVI
jgi:hypothetical protein